MSREEKKERVAERGGTSACVDGRLRGTSRLIQPAGATFQLPNPRSRAPLLVRCCC